MTSGPLRYYAPIEGHELITRRDLIPSEPDHPRTGQWYYKLQLGPLEHKLPPIVSLRWRRITFILTTGDRFMEALEINDLSEQESPAGQLYVRLKELGILVEREWWIWPCPTRVAGCRSPLATALVRPAACASPPNPSPRLACERYRPGCAFHDPLMCYPSQLWPKPAKRPEQRSFDDQ
jgi:hypothetical protein